MPKLFDITKFDSHKEDNRREVKSANGGLPVSLWESYSAMANTYGGVIILGIKELDDRSWRTTGLRYEDKENILDNFWNQAHNPQKVSVNLLSENDIETFEVHDNLVIVIHVPMAKREQKPVYINNDMFRGTYKRTHTGDYHCSHSQVKSMLRDQIEETMDMQSIENMSLEDLNFETVHQYRNRHKSYKPDHIWNNLSDDEYLQMIGAVDKDREGNIHPTGAGLLMFGNEYRILRQYPEYFLDYREMLDPTIRWTDRLQSSSGEWTGNVFDFYFKVYNKIALNIKVPFEIDNGIRVGETPVHRAIREALANCLVNTDFYISRGVVIKLEKDILTIENPGSIRVGKYQMRLGGQSDPRNKALMKMFNIIGVGERAGSGVPELFSVWKNEGWIDPIIEENFDPDRTILIMQFIKKVPKKSAEKKCQKKVPEKSLDKKITKKTQINYEKILNFMETDTWYKANDFVNVLDVKERRIKILLNELVESGRLVEDGLTKGKKYKRK